MTHASAADPVSTNTASPLSASLLNELTEILCAHLRACWQRHAEQSDTPRVLAISEAQLLSDIRRWPAWQTLFTAQSANHSTMLYQQHVLLFHLLLRCQASMLGYRLQLDSATLRLYATSAAAACVEPGALALNDGLPEALLDFYRAPWLELSAVPADIAEQWQQFWQYCQKPGLEAMQLQQALVCLGLSQLPARDELKKRYRQLCHQAHPDKGGAHQDFVSLQQAYQLLKLYCHDGA